MKAGDKITVVVPNPYRPYDRSLDTLVKGFVAAVEIGAVRWRRYEVEYEFAGDQRVALSQRGITWAIGWTSPEASALRTTVALLGAL